VRDGTNKTALDYARKPPPAGPGAPRGENPEAVASRAATVALLESILGKSGAGETVAVTK